MTRVAVTTTPDAAPALALPLAAGGLEPVLLPCITVVPSPAAELEALRGAAARAAWIVVTSPRAVRFVWPAGGMPATPVAAVGPATAAATTAAGGNVALVGRQGAADLIRLLAPQVKDSKVVFPHARGADPATVLALTAAGARVFAAEAYSAAPTPPGPDPVEAVVFASPSAVTGWCLSRDLIGVTVAAIGSATARAVTAAGATVAVSPEHPGFAALAAALADHLAPRSPS